MLVWSSVAVARNEKALYFLSLKILKLMYATLLLLLYSVSLFSLEACLFEQLKFSNFAMVTNAGD